VSHGDQDSEKQRSPSPKVDEQEPLKIESDRSDLVTGEDGQAVATESRQSELLKRCCPSPLANEQPTIYFHEM
jgi:hypothetical protein